MLKRFIVAGILLLLTIPVRADDADDDFYKALAEIVTVPPLDAKSDDCNVKGTVDFGKFATRLPIFREGALNKDFSLDFYNQRRKQVLSFVVLKRIAEMMTESMYRKRSDRECQYSLTISYPDKFGQDRSFEALTWRFNGEQSAKINWDKFDPRNFHEVALDYKIKDQVMKWVSDEPSMAETKPPAAQPDDSCDIFMFNANAVFIRATTYCKKNYMDTKEGYAALAGAKKCAMSDAEMEAKAKSAMMILDNLARKQGRSAVCPFVEGIAREVDKRTD